MRIYAFHLLWLLRIWLFRFFTFKLLSVALLFSLSTFGAPGAHITASFGALGAHITASFLMGHSSTFISGVGCTCMWLNMHIMCINICIYTCMYTCMCIYRYIHIYIFMVTFHHLSWDNLVYLFVWPLIFLALEAVAPGWWFDMYIIYVYI